MKTSKQFGANAKMGILATTLAVFVSSAAGCAVEDSEPETNNNTATSIVTAPPHPLQGLWRGLSAHVSGNTTLDHDTLISFYYIGSINPDIISSRYKYINYPGTPVCRSTLTQVVATATYYEFDDETNTPGCIDGIVTLETTADPNELYFRWMDLAGNVENEGPVYR